jgi:hypothetical protein
VITSQTPDQVSCARVGSAGTAGTVEVRVCRSDPDITTMLVSYDLTALINTAFWEINTFTSNYEHEMAEWAADIRAAVNAFSDHHWAPAALPCLLGQRGRRDHAAVLRGLRRCSAWSSASPDQPD